MQFLDGGLVYLIWRYGTFGMTRESEILDEIDESFPFVLGPVLRVMNRLEQEGLFKRYVIGGSMALMYYSEPFFTDDVDFFCYLRQQGLLFDLGPIFTRLGELGCKASGLYMIIEGVPIQFLAPDGPLLGEAMASALDITMGGVPTRIFQLEYALAIKAQANRKKDWKHIVTALDSAEVDTKKLENILHRFGLLEAWRRHVDD